MSRWPSCTSRMPALAAVAEELSQHELRWRARRKEEAERHRPVPSSQAEQVSATKTLAALARRWRSGWPEAEDAADGAEPDSAQSASALAQEDSTAARREAETEARLGAAHGRGARSRLVLGRADGASSGRLRPAGAGSLGEAGARAARAPAHARRLPRGRSRRIAGCEVGVARADRTQSSVSAGRAVSGRSLERDSSEARGRSELSATTRRADARALDSGARHADGLSAPRRDGSGPSVAACGCEQARGSQCAGGAGARPGETLVADYGPDRTRCPLPAPPARRDRGLLSGRRTADSNRGHCAVRPC